MPRKPRRAFLTALGAGVAGLAGCATSDGADTTTAAPERTTTAADLTTTTSASTTAGSTTTAAREVPTTGPPLAGVEAFEDAVPELLRQWDVPGAAVSVVKDGRLVFARGYGLADRERESPVRPASLFRVGSLSKPVTAVAVLDLVERGELSLDDRVFEVLDEFLPDGGPADERLTETTVRQHLRHTAGWDLAEIGFDPAFAPARVAEAEGVEPPADADTTVRFLARQTLGSDPGARFNYVNAGYIVLARVVEAVTGTSYETHVRENVLADLGASRMAVGATGLDGRLEDEVRYYGQTTAGSSSSSPDSADAAAPGPYDGFHLPALDGAGGWVGSTVDLLRFVRGVTDRRGGGDGVLDSGTVERMTARPDVPTWDGAQQFYGMGWYVVPGGGTSAPTLWHNGSLPGSYGYVVHSGSGDLALAALFNGRSAGREFQTFNGQVQQTLNEALGSVSTWPDRDLFGRFE
jgi:CubicO group peptidase (beta-lactamase class C family)